MLGRIPADIGHYLAGFADGEGSFNVCFRPREDYSFPWKISLCFNISQKDEVILSLYKKHLAQILVEKRHLTKDGVEEILSIRKDMNDGGKRKYSDEMIRERFENPQR